MGHSTSSGRTSGSPTLSAEQRDELRRVISEDRGEGTALNAAAGLRQYTRQMRSDNDILNDIYNSRADDETPAQTVERFERRVGVERATNTIATLVNQNASDGRLSRYNRSWASEQSGALRSNETRISTSLHMAHLNQVADAMRKRNDDRAFQSASRAAAQRAREVRGVGNDNFGQQVLRRNNRRR